MAALAWGLPALFPAAWAAGATRSLPLHSDPLHEDGIRLGRAALEQSLGHDDRVIEQLEGIDFSIEPRFAEADRAAFLLGQAYLRVGSADRFATLARAVASWRQKSVYTQWIAFEELLAETRGSAPPPSGMPPERFGPPVPDTLVSITAVGMGAADALAAGLLLQQGNKPAALAALGQLEPRGEARAMADYLRTLAAGEADTLALERLVHGDTTTTLGRDLAAAARIRLAVRAIARGADPAPLLEGVSPRSRYTSRARHMRGLYVIESGDPEGGRAILESVLAGDSSYVARRDLAMALASQSMARGEWSEALARYEEIDREWRAQENALRSILPQRQFDSLWQSWEAGGPLSDLLTLDALPARMLAEQLAKASTNLSTRPTSAAPELGAPAAVPSLRWPVAPPPTVVLREVARSASRADEAAYDVERIRHAAGDERLSLSDLRRYLDQGLAENGRERDSLKVGVAGADSLFAVLDRVDERLRAVRDEAKRRVAARGARVLALAERQQAWASGLGRFYRVTPPGLPRDGATADADSLTRVEEALAQKMVEFARRLALEGPDLIDRSYQHAWRPNMIDRARTNRAELWRLRSWSERLDPSLQTARNATSTSPTLQQLEGSVAHLSRTRDSLRVAYQGLRERVARDAVANALAAIETEREGIDYGLSVAAYALSAGLSLADSSTATAVADTASDDPESARRRQAAIASMQAFLERHPRSPARGEMRFRLADLSLTDARQEFRGRMARYLAGQSAGHAAGPPPVLSYAPAYRLYQAILKEDLDYPHLDAVRFNAGMILADQGDPEAERYFRELVAATPDSRYAQEAYTRMGDQHFNAHDFAGAIPLYRKAAQGRDLTLRAISLYKVGWAEFNGEHFMAAANAFQSVMDVYDSTRGQRIDVDIASESESYLIHSLARAGGAAAFARHFDESGARPYERRVLRGLGDHFRRYSLFAEAAAAEQLYLERYPRDADALGSAERLAETYERWNRPELARQARLDNAARFAPRGEWADAQPSDSIRAAGAAFSKSAWTAVARQHHLQARERGAAEDWREALRLYQQVLAGWPQDPDAPLYELYSGEASAHLGDYEAARAHYSAAAHAGPDSVAKEAMWQRVVVTDAWYEKSRPGKPGAAQGLGSDSLAHAVIQASDDLATRYPEHPRRADARWRTGHLALAHGWYDRAATDFGALAAREAKDPRAAAAAALQAEALFQLGRYGEAGQAYETALTAARDAHSDSLARKAEAAIPLCYYRQAEAAVAADSTAYAHHAELFEQVARQWPRYPYAPLAQYRAALAYARAGKTAESVAALETLIHNFPKSEYVKDAHLRIARTWEEAKQPAKAGEAYAEFAARYPADTSAAAASLRAADLFASGGLESRADTLRLAYVRQHPGDVETAMEVYEALAKRELAEVSPQHPISRLLASERSASHKGIHNRLQPAAPAPRPSSYLAEYLRRANQQPRLASRPLIAELRFRQGEEAYASYDSVHLVQPLPKSIPVRQRRLDSLMVAYRRCADLAVPEWSRASTFRIGQALVGFGAALEQSDRPADLHGEDLRGYDEVLKQQAQVFYDRGEGVWSELLKQSRDVSGDPWVARAQTALWTRLGGRFYFRPEVEYPLVAGSAPDRVKPAENKKHKHAKEEPVDPLREAREQMALSASPYWPYRLAQASLAADSIHAAEAQLSASLARDSSYAPALSLLAKLDFETGRHQQAIDLLESRRARSGDFPAALMVGLALQYDAIEQSEQARAVFAAAKQPPPARGTADVYLALRGSTPEAGTPLAEQALEDAPKSAANQNNYGITRLRAGDPTAAREALEKAIALDPHLPGPYYNLAILEKFFVFDDGAATKWFAQYWNRSHADPDRLAQAFGVAIKDVAEKKD